MAAGSVPLLSDFKGSPSDFSRVALSVSAGALWLVMPASDSLSSLLDAEVTEPCSAEGGGGILPGRRENPAGAAAVVLITGMG